MIFSFSFKLWARGGKLSCRFLVYKTYRTISNAPLDTLWHKIIHIADVSWHPLFAKTNLPQGLIAKPGLFYQVVTKLTPIPIRMFVENVRPRELLTIRILAIPGMEQRITYQIESTLCGTYISYSITLKGWLSPLMWWWIRPYCDRVAIKLAQAVENPLAMDG
ncbi:MAG: SRPBCC family protein [Xenococcaceae cyanobacterium MO_167.B52]|nr:SRPBCC family protein [Xenococcaceae cyanobacterium MO_167.B52]